MEELKAPRPLASAVGPGIQSYNTAFLGQYPPGSTFKVVSTAALLERDAVRLDEPDFHRALGGFLRGAAERVGV